VPRLCFFLAVLSPFALAFGWFLISIPPGGTAFSTGNLPGLGLLALSPVALFASAMVGIKQILDGRRSGTGWLAAGLVISYCWFHILCAAFIIQQVRGH
jgi:hypothetical protein